MHFCYPSLQPVYVQLFRLRKIWRPTKPGKLHNSIRLLTSINPLCHIYFSNFTPFANIFVVFYLWNCFYGLLGPIRMIQQMALCALEEARDSAPGVDRNISTAPPPSPPPPVRIISLALRCFRQSDREEKRERKKETRVCFATQSYD